MDSGLALYASLNTSTPPMFSRSSRIEGSCASRSPARISSSSIPIHRAAATAQAMLPALCLPMVGAEKMAPSPSVMRRTSEPSCRTCWAETIVTSPQVDAGPSLSSATPTRQTAASAPVNNSSSNSGTLGAKINPSPATPCAKEIFSRAIASTDPKPPRCALPTFVMIPMSGLTRAARAAISPGELEPTSQMRYSSVRDALSIVNGVPM